uniref:Protein kinase domain-containing protein n=1 Tax=Chromera velia CCMP2878 TaxID=1169474 RepID=A0A0G4IAE3_9ALVE|eukprot:Cvel_2099.t1-p1 / transcript=Cvel_2099.t1 / gene=Cvel_2099 / organism=Chromera_velia_CCMP2878 / gene_product=Ankyrin repeat domain-containing protein 29, putative / transcript_product=Ankyrin repeat domain-containing protein 29, putative / location=Cvel_scaffold81:23655-34438(+) / protein_length=1102 / sequence_SO=supercontig / SO=protein_coding / is_pseudo=false
MKPERFLLGGSNANSCATPPGEGRRDGSSGDEQESLLEMNSGQLVASLPLGAPGQSGGVSLLLGVDRGGVSADVSAGWVLPPGGTASGHRQSGLFDVGADSPQRASQENSVESGPEFPVVLLEQPQRDGQGSGTASAHLTRTDLPDGVKQNLMVEAIPGLSNLKKLGQGGFGEVWSGDLHGGAVAVKMIAEKMKNLGHTLGKTLRRETHKKHIAREVLALMNGVLEVDPHICKFFGAYPARGCTLLVLELCEGGDLTKLTSGGRRLSVKAATSITRTIAETLDRLNKKGIRHLDLKQANVLLKRLPVGDLDSEIDAVCEGIRISDFGLAQTQIGGGSVVGTAGGGTPSYMAPEQWENGQVTEKADVYALGFILWELLSGKRAWEGKSREAIRDLVFRGDRPFLEEIPSEMRPFVSCMWTQKAAQRLTAKECAECLNPMLDDLSFFSRPSPETLFGAVAKGDSVLVKALLKLGSVDVNYLKSGRTPAECSIFCRHHEKKTKSLKALETLQGNVGGSDLKEEDTDPSVSAHEGDFDLAVSRDSASRRNGRAQSVGRADVGCEGPLEGGASRSAAGGVEGGQDSSGGGCEGAAALGDSPPLTDEERRTLAAVPGLEVPESSFWREGMLGPFFKGTLHGQPVAIERVLVRSAEAEKEVSAMLSAMRSGVSHTNIRKAFGSYACTETGSTLLVLEPCESDLATLTSKGPLSVKTALSVIQSIAQTLSSLQGHEGGLGFFHGALRLESVLLKENPKSLECPSQSIRLSGFGLTRSGGMPLYMAPEQWEGGAPTERADVYALGFILWELLSGKRAWEGKSEEAMRDLVLRGDRPSLEAMSPGVSEFVCRMWRQETAERPTAAEIVKELKEAGDTKALFDAVKRSDALTVRKLVAFGLVDIDCRDDEGMTPLFHAASNGQSATVSLLLEAGADKEKAHNHGWTPLHVAAMYGHNATVSLLLEAGADKERADKDGLTPLFIAAEFGHDSVVFLLLQAGADKEKADKEGMTPLNTAADRGNDSVVSLLLEAGADKEKANNRGRTALFHAASNGHSTTVSILLKAGADKEKADIDGNTALGMARSLLAPGYFEWRLLRDLRHRQGFEQVVTLL